MNMYNADHIANSAAFRDGYDAIIWEKGEYSDTAEERKEEKGELDVGSFSWLFGV